MAAFQSSPTPGSRCNAASPSGRPARRRCFNPHRLLGVGATRNLRQPTRRERVSILTDSWESVQPARATPRRPAMSTSFNPHRLLGVGATRAVLRRGRQVLAVSILTDSWESVQRTTARARPA